MIPCDTTEIISRFLPDLREGDKQHYSSSQGKANGEEEGVGALNERYEREESAHGSGKACTYGQAKG